MAKLMGQMGKPYRWGGSSPRTGFDCSGLIYYAYKDVVKIKMPRTANEMYHLRDAAPIKKSELESGDLVFFRINNRGVADHVGVYLGNGNSSSRHALAKRSASASSTTTIGKTTISAHAA